ncbi:MAG TPA: hypothetical protein VMF07_11605 [Solirubrobacteraceae bacterium]|nr:hypothetical protein [Solirubrobacteraceae bacterium]
MPDPPPSADADALRALEERLERATRTAERLLAEAREPSAEDDGGGVPPRGWQRRGEGAGDGPGLGGWIDPEDARLLLTVLAELRERVPPELERRVVEALRELLLALRALIDWCVERAERRSAPAAEVQDIPIL